MFFKYKAITRDGREREGAIDAISEDSAIVALQKRGLIVSDIRTEGDTWVAQIQRSSFFSKVPNRDMVILSRQISTLFDAHISIVRVFKLLSEEVENETLRLTLLKVADDVQDGSPLSVAFSRHPRVFSSFYINMVASGEESGQLKEAFKHLANYLERMHELVSKAKHALVYPTFVVIVFLVVMIVMFTFVVPQIAGILIESGQEVPIYTKIVLAVSAFLVSYGVFLLIIAVALGSLLVWWTRTPKGSEVMASFKLAIPYIGRLYQKLYLARISDTLNTLLASGVSMTRAIEVSAKVVDNEIYKRALEEISADVQSGTSVPESFAKHEEIPNMFVHMLKVSEEGGAIGSVLGTLADFYQKEVSIAVDTIMSLIEPLLILLLGLFVGILLASVLLPIYDIAMGV